MTNTSVVELADGREVLFSYGVPVAAFIPGRGYVKTEERYSVTTSKHVNAWTDKRATPCTESYFRELIAPVVKARIF